MARSTIAHDLDAFVPYQVLAPATPTKPAVLVTRPPPEPEPEEPPSVRDVISDLRWLVPAFRARVRAMVAELDRQGYAPRVWETWRSEERADWLQRKGSSANGRLSMHRYGVAVDVICREHWWDCPTRDDCDFYRALGAEAKRQRLYWGGHWRTIVDRPHVQAVPIRLQGVIRRHDDPAHVVEVHMGKRPVRESA